MDLSLMSLTMALAITPPLSGPVAEELDFFIRTSDGRQRIEEGLIRMEDFRSIVEGELAAMGVPLELAVIPLVESGYENTPDLDGRGQCCAGLWQFRRDTARTLGLIVNKKVDERRAVKKSSRAAAKLLARQYRRFKDWGLAIAAYNAGERAVEKAIRHGRTRDVGVLVEKRRLPRYAAKVLAAMVAVRRRAPSPPTPAQLR
jgi:membrane-bound lytic murein transglycosylase D